MNLLFFFELVKVPSPFETTEDKMINGMEEKEHESTTRLQSLLQMSDKELTKK